MSERGFVVSEIVAQLVSAARHQEGISVEELADRAGVHRSYVGLVERRARQPTIAVAASLAQALGLSLADLVAEAEHDSGKGSAPDVELLPAPPRRQADRAHLGTGFRLEQATSLTGDMVAGAVEFAYRKLDLIDEQMRASGSRPLVGLVDVPELSALVCNLLSAGIARTASGLFVQNAPERSPSLLPLGRGLPELEVEAALETSLPANGPAKAGAYLVFRYVLAGRDGTFTRGRDSRGDTVAVWEIRFGELGLDDFHTAAARSENGSARLRKDAFDRMEIVYYDPALLPYAKATGVYARRSRAETSG